jgi:predicted nucleic acid-binding protein
VQELIGVLAYPTFRLSGPEQAELLADYLPFVQTVTMPSVLPQVPYCSDPMDLPFLQLALVGQARVLVSLDRDVLDLAEAFAHFGGCPIHNLDTFGRTFVSE